VTHANTAAAAHAAMMQRRAMFFPTLIFAGKVRTAANKKRQKHEKDSTRMNLCNSMASRRWLVLWLPLLLRNDRTGKFIHGKNIEELHNLVPFK
jgi:hypothetical protein